MLIYTTCFFGCHDIDVEHILHLLQEEQTTQEKHYVQRHNVEFNENVHVIKRLAIWRRITCTLTKKLVMRSFFHTSNVISNFEFMSS